MPGDVGKESTDRQPTVTVLLKLPGRPQQISLLGKRDSREVKR